MLHDGESSSMLSVVSFFLGTPLPKPVMIAQSEWSILRDQHLPEQTGSAVSTGEKSVLIGHV